VPTGRQTATIIPLENPLRKTAVKHRILCLLLLAVSLPAFADAFKKVTVAQLSDILTGLQHANKSDEEVASELSGLELTEELTSATMHSMANLIPGPHSTEQLYVLEARSSMLAPPASDLPGDAPLDPAAQQALLAKAQDLAAKDQLPSLTANRMTARFQDGVQTIQTFTSAKAKSGNEQDPVIDRARSAVHLMNTHQEAVEIKNGIAQPVAKEKIAWGSNGLVASIVPPRPLPETVQEISANGAPKWLRWELINGKPAAVFAYSVDKKKSRYSLAYCCFPDTSNIGNNLYGGNAKPGSGGGSGLSASPAAHPSGGNGNLSTISDWKNFNVKSSGYHGELFLDPATGTVLRTIVEADFKPSDFVHNEQIRVDYATLPIAGQSLVIPLRIFTLAEIVPNGDSFAAKYAVRHNLVTEDFKDFAPAGK
jgi:hypothetical protein